MARPSIFTHRKFRKLSRILGSEALALGHLEMMWNVGYMDGDPRLGESLDVESSSRWSGTPGKLTKALLDSGFIDDLQDGTYQIHELYDHAPEYVRKRMDREDKRRERGLTLREIRSAAGAKGANSRWQVDGKAIANGSTPAPAPAPAPKNKKRTSQHFATGFGPGFLDFWKNYPDRNGKKVGKAAAWKHWKALGCEDHAGKIVIRLLAQIAHKSRCDRDGVFCAEFPDPERWIKHKRWTDEIFQPADTAPAIRDSNRLLTEEERSR